MSGLRIASECSVGSNRRSAWRQMVSAVLLSFILILHQVEGIEWLSIASTNSRHWNRTADCVKAKEHGLVKQQIQICKRNMELMPVVAHATRQTTDVCQYLFAQYRWNCTSVRMAPKYLPDLTGGSREQAYVHALSAAALAQTISKACTQGATTKCSCGRIPNEAPPSEFKWGGCGDDLRFGMIFSASFADSPFLKRKKRSKQAMMNLHNNNAGRKIISDSLVTDCKCHGVSGSCNIKTCWKALPDMRTVGTKIQERYRLAVEVVNKKVKNSKERRFVPLMDKKTSFSENELIYYTKSPDYCLPDGGLGSMGTRGRECEKTNDGSIGCQSMCCGRGFTSQVVEVKHRCECKYFYCCYVECKTCTKKVEINRCR